MNKFFLSLLLIFFLPLISWAQGLTYPQSFGTFINWQANQTIEYQNGTRESLTFKSSLLTISPFIARRFYKQLEFGVRGAFIWNRQTRIEKRREEVLSKKTDLFLLSGALTTRYYYDYPEQKIRTFLHLDKQILLQIGDNEISDVAGLILFGIGAMYQMNPRLAIETIVSTRIMSTNLNKIKGYRNDVQFWVGFRYNFVEKNAP